MKKKTIILVLFSIGAIGVFVFFLTKNKPETPITKTSTQNNNEIATTTSEDQYASLQTQCANHGKYVFQKFQEGQDRVNSSVDTTWQVPEYHFNTRLDTCLLSWQTSSVVRGIKFKEGAVVDIQDIYAINELLRDVDSHGRWEEYVKQKDVLMRE